MYIKTSLLIYQINRQHTLEHIYVVFVLPIVYTLLVLLNKYLDCKHEISLIIMWNCDLETLWLRIIGLNAFFFLLFSFKMRFLFKELLNFIEKVSYESVEGRHSISIGCDVFLSFFFVGNNYLY